MLASILGARLSWHFANGWVFEPAIVGPDVVEYTLTAGPHAGRHAIQHFYYQRVAPGTGKVLRLLARGGRMECSRPIQHP
jgi:hypothetical protein